MARRSTASTMPKNMATTSGAATARRLVTREWTGIKTKVPRSMAGRILTIKKSGATTKSTTTSGGRPLSYLSFLWISFVIIPFHRDKDWKKKWKSWKDYRDHHHGDKYKGHKGKKVGNLPHLNHHKNMDLL